MGPENFLKPDLEKYFENKIKAVANTYQPLNLQQVGLQILISDKTLKLCFDFFGKRGTSIGNWSSIFRCCNDLSRGGLAVKADEHSRTEHSFKRTV
jgi:hypothetical protein